jgi:hypothetical protein
MLLTFTKPKFEGLIKENIKQHTIRADKNNRWKVGNTIQFWNGNPRNVHSKNKPNQFGTGVCSRVETIFMQFQKSAKDFTDMVKIGETILESKEELNALAINDGFDNWEQMRIFFGNEGNCFSGKIIFWKDFSPNDAKPVLPAVPIDGKVLYEGDRVYSYDYDVENFAPKKCYGTLHKNKDYPEVSEWYIAYDDGQECAVLQMSLVFKA